jgi:hypothetical protein
VYFAADGSTLTLPSANQGGQQIQIVSTSTMPLGWTINTAGTDKLYSGNGLGLAGATTWNPGASGIVYVALISSGSGRWYVVNTQ